MTVPAAAGISALCFYWVGYDSDRADLVAGRARNAVWQRLRAEASATYLKFLHHKRRIRPRNFK